MSSHREAPKIAADPVADSADLYAFVSPDRPDTVTIIANYIPLQAPAGGPNFYNFGDDVLYEIHINNSGNATPDITYQFQFTTQIKNPNTFLYNTGPIASLDDPNWNLRQVYTVTRVTADGRSSVIGSDIPCPPCNVGARSIPNYAALSKAAVSNLRNGEIVFAGQRNDAFFVDLGAIFDLGDIRPLQHLHLLPTPDAPVSTQPAALMSTASPFRSPSRCSAKTARILRTSPALHRSLESGRPPAGARRACATIRQAAPTCSRVPGCRSRDWGTHLLMKSSCR